MVGYKSVSYTHLDVYKRQKYNRSMHENTEYSYKHSMSPAVMSQIKPIFRDLSSENLLIKCLHGKTQNMNESVNRIIWTQLPKSTFVGLETLQFGVLDAVACYNDGNAIKCLAFELSLIHISNWVVFLDCK